MREAPKFSWKTLKFLLSYLKKFKLQLFLVAILLVISSVVMVIGISFLKPIINDYILPGDFIGLFRILSIMGVVYLLGAMASYGYARIMLHIAQKAVYNIRKDLFDKMQKLPLYFFDKHTHGELMSRYTNDIDNIMEILNNTFVDIVSSAILLIGNIIMMAILSPVLTLIAVCTLILIIIATKTITSKSGYYFREQQKNLGHLNGYIEEMIEGQKVIKVFCHEQEAIKEFQIRNNELRDSSTKAQIYAGLLMPTLHNLSYINYALISCIGSVFAITGKIDVGTLVTFIQYTRQFAQPVSRISNQMNTILAALAGAERVHEIMQEADEVDEGVVTLVNVMIDSEGQIVETNKYTGKWAWKIKNGDTEELRLLKGDVRFNDVTFGYDKEVILKNVSLFAKPGQKIAFVGPTGAGKTTISSLINRFYEIDKGTITYDGINIKDIKKDDLRKSIAMVLQDTHLFTGTIEDNIRFGNLEASDEAVVEAAKLANADFFIRALPQGYKTIITSDGENLSQGQRQLISIARAAIVNPPVLILDEATSSIDTMTEKLIESAMDKLMEDRTVFVIAHRLSTIKNSKAILVLEHGEIIERGTHDELLEQKGKYYQLYTGKTK